MREVSLKLGNYVSATDITNITKSFSRSTHGEKPCSETEYEKECPPSQNRFGNQCLKSKEESHFDVTNFTGSCYPQRAMVSVHGCEQRILMGNGNKTVIKQFNSLCGVGFSCCWPNFFTPASNKYFLPACSLQPRVSSHPYGVSFSGVLFRGLGIS